MKKGIVLFFVLFFTISSLYGCASKPKTQAEKLVGTWFGVTQEAGNIAFDKSGAIRIFNEMMDLKGTYSLPAENKLTITMKGQTGQDESQTFDIALEKDLFKIIPPTQQGQQAPPVLEFKRATEKEIADYKLKQEEAKKAMEDATKNVEEAKNEAASSYVVFETSMGNIKMELYSDAAPRTVANFLKLVKEGFYNNLIFHRVIPDFMIQTGGVKIDGTPKEVGYKFEDEINPKALGLTDQAIQQNTQQGYVYNETLKSIKLQYGVLAMANAGPNTNGSQIFIITKKDGTDWLNGLHTGFGKVVEGMDVALKIQSVPTFKDPQNQQNPNNDKPLTNVIIKLAKLVPKK